MIPDTNHNLVISLLQVLSTKLSDFVIDASRFIVNFYDPISQSTPHIYISALPLSPTESLMAKCYRSQFPRTISAICGLDQTWPACANVFRGHTSRVLCVAHSPNGMRIASGSSDNTIRTWDAQTGQTIAGPFEGHTDWIRSVAYSPDGTRVASGSDDNTIRIWDTQTGQTIAGPFEGHTRFVYSVAFSPDGTRVASGSWDNTIRIWDAQLGHTSGSLNTNVIPISLHTNQLSSIGGSRIFECFRNSAERRVPSWMTLTVPSTSGSHSLLVWVPPANRMGICAKETLLICGTRTTRVDLSRFVHGKDWIQCYDPATAPTSSISVVDSS